ncbi:hypothetical protein [Catenuloplanes indicus]|uniref:Uncharacterized protein n=1 Tax=Catenuloplanes indicus TaxID=137267 RepID=A0AAE3VWD0_9ACTN|nr:hypothetical protein [Catenuloplanes indicus]MDQ0364946.1 hypothetical protein [Catenuloplanes indicus]
MSDAEPLWNPRSLLSGGTSDDAPPAPVWQPPTAPRATAPPPAAAAPAPPAEPPSAAGPPSPPGTPPPAAGPPSPPGATDAVPVAGSGTGWPVPPPVRPGSGGSGAAGRNRRLATAAGVGLVVVAAVGGLTLAAGAEDEPAAGPPAGPAAAEQSRTGPAAAEPLPTGPAAGTLPAWPGDPAGTRPDASYPRPATPALDEATEDTLALNALARQHARDRGAIVFTGQHVAQLASKIPGIEDPHQYAADGSHTFRATDILAEHETLRAGPNPGATVLLLKSTEYGIRQLYEGEPLWVTVAVGDFADRDAVLTWCSHRFPDLTGVQLENRCAARTLEP